MLILSWPCLDFDLAISIWRFRHGDFDLAISTWWFRLGDFDLAISTGDFDLAILTCKFWLVDLFKILKCPSKIAETLQVQWAAAAILAYFLQNCSLMQAIALTYWTFQEGQHTEYYPLCKYTQACLFTLLLTASPYNRYRGVNRSLFTLLMMSGGVIQKRLLTPIDGPCSYVESTLTNQNVSAKQQLGVTSVPAHS
jgi:hypothetical protein